MSLGTVIISLAPGAILLL